MRIFTYISSINLIELFNSYLMLAFVIGIIIRLRNYRAILGLIFTFSTRWPKLLLLAKSHRIVFFRWPTYLPLAITLGLTLGNAFASFFIWSQAKIAFSDVWKQWWSLLMIGGFGGWMLYLDYKAIFSFGRFDRAKLEENLEKAEHWLESWQAPVLRFFTFGLINPRKIVNDRVLLELTKASLVVNGNIWRVSLQIAIRVAVSLSIWLTWAIAVRK
ncbi:MAG: hypothetical protein R3B84_00720 [Zavarzinella sp.]